LWVPWNAPIEALDALELFEKKNTPEGPSVCEKYPRSQNYDSSMIFNDCGKLLSLLITTKQKTLLGWAMGLTKW